MKSSIPVRGIADGVLRLMLSTQICTQPQVTQTGLVDTTTTTKKKKTRTLPTLITRGIGLLVFLQNSVFLPSVFLYQLKL